MFRAIKSESIKYFSGKMIYICIIITMLLAVIDYGLSVLLMTLEPEVARDIAFELQSMVTQEYMLNSLLNLFSGGVIFVLISIISASIISEDYGKGTMKYSLLALSKRELILGKIITGGILSATLTIAALLSAGVIGVLAFEWGSDSYSLIQVVGGYFMGWLGLLGFTCLIMFIMTKIDNLGGAIGASVGVYFTVGLLSRLIHEPYNSFIITANFYKIMDMSISSWLEVAATAIGYILIFTILSLISFNRKEILY